MLFFLASTRNSAIINVRHLNSTLIVDKRLQIISKVSKSHNIFANVSSCNIEFVVFNDTLSVSIVIQCLNASVVTGPWK